MPRMTSAQLLALADAMAERLRHHATCSDHRYVTDGDDNCPSCRDRAALSAYVSARGLRFVEPTPGRAVYLQDLPRTPIGDPVDPPTTGPAGTVYVRPVDDLRAPWVELGTTRHPPTADGLYGTAAERRRNGVDPA
jgi:hypothetical protein